MKVEVGKVTIVRISELGRLDPIRVTLDDIEPGKGRINIECYGKAWASYWGAMGKRSIADFVMSCDNGYLISNFSPGMWATHHTGEALEADAKRVIRHRRKGIGEWRYMPLSAEDAKELMDRVHRLQDCNGEGSAWAQSSLLTEIYGEDWPHIAKAEAPNPEYEYLSRI